MYIYILLKNNTPFYVGRTSNLKNRLATHKKKYGIDISINEIDSCDYAESVDLESHYINSYFKSGYPLVNKYKGTTTQAKSNKLKKALIKNGVKPVRKYTKRTPKITAKIEIEPRNEAEYQKFIKNFELFLSSKC